MAVNLVAYTQPHEDFTGAIHVRNVQDLVAYCARVSNPGNQSTTETNERLIKYLIKNKHWSPFEMASATLEIITTRDIARQILRHRSFSFQEFSQRYADVTAVGSGLEFIVREARLQDMKNRQNSIAIDDDDIEKKYVAHQWEKKQKDLIKWVDEQYRWAIENGIAKEQARVILPEGLTQSRLYMSGTIRSWIHYIELRSANGTQLEHQQIAQQCATELAKIIPSLANFQNT
jgi:thymidylate synthase (FAD)